MLSLLCLFFDMVPAAQPASSTLQVFGCSFLQGLSSRLWAAAQRRGSLQLVISAVCRIPRCLWNLLTERAEKTSYESRALGS